MNIKSWCLRLEISDNFFYQYIVVDDSRIGRFPYIQKDLTFMKNSLFSNISYKRSLNHPLSARLT